MTIPVEITRRDTCLFCGQDIPRLSGWHRPAGDACYIPDCDHPYHFSDPRDFTPPVVTHPGTGGPSP